MSLKKLRHNCIKAPAMGIIITSTNKGVFAMIDRICLILSIIGGINWGSIGLFKFDIVAWICGGQTSVLSRIIYVIVGLSALWCISLLFRERKEVLDR